ncbi:MAG TPA: hypothetical protein VHG72_20360 [Polyangia bacterium]|nr:hypothetical protein [Polyangia bacterium]
MYSRRGVRWCTVAFVALCVGLGAGATARAAEADELAVSARAGIGTVSADGRHPWGSAFGADAEYGIADGWAARASLEGQLVSVSKVPQSGLPGGLLHTDAALIGVTYTIDILRIVPYAYLQIGVAQIGGAVRVPVTMLASELGVGGDYFISPRLRAGLSAQYLYRPQDLFSNPQGLGNAPFTFSVTARLGWTF